MIYGYYLCVYMYVCIYFSWELTHIYACLSTVKP